MDKIAQDIVSKYSEARNYLRPIRDNELKYYKQYRAWLDTDTQKDFYKWRSKLFIPATGRAIDGLLPDLLLTTFSQDPFFNVKPRAYDDIERAKQMESLMSYQFDECDFFNNYSMFLKQIAMYGTSFGKVYWKKETKNTKRRKEEKFMGLGFGNYKLTEETDIIFDGPVFEPIENRNIVYSPKATSLDDTWIIHRIERTLGYLKQKQKEGIYSGIDDLENYLMSNSSEEARNEIERKRIAGLTVPFNGEEGDRRLIEVLEYWDENREKVVTVAGRFVKIRDKDNPLFIDPFVRGTLWDGLFEMQGIGVAERVCDLQDQLNAEVNSRMDNRSLKQNFIIKVRRGANVNTRSLVSKPGAIWLTDDMTALDVLQIPDIASSSSFAEENLLKQEIEEITGVTKYATGSGANTGSKTATEVSTLQRMGSKSFALLVKKLEEQVLKPIIKKFYQLNEIMMESDKVVRILGTESPQFQKVSPNDIRGDYDFIPAASSQLTNKDMKVQQMIQLIGLAKDDPTLNRKEIYKKIWTLWGNKDFNDLFNQQPQMPGPAMLPLGPGGPPLGPGGAPANPTDIRMPTPQEGTNPIQLMGGGING